jgi:hypothetical protein
MGRNQRTSSDARARLVRASGVARYQPLELASDIGRGLPPFIGILGEARADDVFEERGDERL